MFPENTLKDEIQNYKNLEKYRSTLIGKTPSFNYEKSQIIITNGTPKLVTDIEAIEQWIILFVTTPKDVYEIYKGTNFGTSYRKLLGKKTVNNGYVESELEREIKEGLHLNPAIKSVRSIEIDKYGKTLRLNIQAELYNGKLLETFIEKTYKVS